MGFDIERPGDASVCVLHLDGDVDIVSVPRVRDALRSTLEGGSANFVIDLGEVSYLDSSALGLLVWLDHQVGPLGGRIVLAAAGRDVSRILELSGLVAVAPSITATGSVEGALEGFELPAVPAEIRWTEDVSAPAQVETLADMRSRVVELLAGLALSEAAVFDIKVAVGEALANAVRHGSPAGERGEVHARVTAYPDRVAISVMDSGVGFFNGEPARADDVYAPCGRGIMFMRALMDRVTFEPAPGGGTIVTLVKHLKPRGF